MTLFLIIGAVGLALILASLFMGDLVEGFLGDADAGAGFLSGPVIGGFLAAFGFVAALILYSTSASSVVASIGGAVAGAGMGGLAGFFTRSLINMPTEKTPQSSDLVGANATVVTRIPAGGIGEVSLSHGGHLMKLGARSAEPVEAGTAVKITSVTSPSSVVVAPLTIE